MKTGNMSGTLLIQALHESIRLEKSTHFRNRQIYRAGVTIFIFYIYVLTVSANLIISSCYRHFACASPTL